MNKAAKDYLKKAKDEYISDQTPISDAIIDNFDPNLMAKHIMELDPSLTPGQALNEVIRELHRWNQIGSEEAKERPRRGSPSRSGLRSNIKRKDRAIGQKYIDRSGPDPRKDRVCFRGKAV